MKKLLKNILLLVIHFLIFNPAIQAKPIESAIKISEEDLTQLFKSKSWQFKTGSYQFDCSSYSVFSEEAQMVISGKKVFPVQDLLTHQRSHQCQVIYTDEKKSSYGKAIFSIWNTNTSQKFFWVFDAR